MKTYADVILLSAKTAFSAYLANSNDIWPQVDFSLIAFIYERPVQEVERDIKTVYDIVSTAHYSRFASSVAAS
jgi:hypothetical protein